MSSPAVRIRSLVRGAAVSAAVACTLALAACGGSDGDASSATTTGALPAGTEQVRLLNVPRIEQAIVSSVKEQRDITATVKCPAGQKQQQGLSFECVARYRVPGRSGRQRAVFVVSQGTNGNVTYAAK